jgi:predicted CoA-binding protein
LRKAGYEVFAVNPGTDQVEGEACYHDLSSIPGGVEAVVIVTAPSVTRDVVSECAALKVPRVWMHRSFGTGSVDQEAVSFCREHDISVIAGGCPMMFLREGDFGHKCMRWMLSVTGGLPKQV